MRLGGTASSGDFTLSGATLHWTPGSATGTVTISAGSDQATVTIIATNLPANDEVVDFTLVPPPDEDFWSVGDHESAAVTLLGDDSDSSDSGDSSSDSVNLVVPSDGDSPAILTLDGNDDVFFQVQDSGPNEGGYKVYGLNSNGDSWDLLVDGSSNDGDGDVDPVT